MKKGTICVERMVDGQREWLSLAPEDQWKYREWVGCFSIWYP